MLFYAVFLLLLMPEIIQTGHITKLLFIAVRGFAGIIAAYLLIVYKHRSRMMMSLLIYLLYMLIVTLLKGFSKANIVRYVAIYVDIFIIAVFTEHLITYDTEKYIKYLYYVFSIGLIINVLSVFLCPNGLVRVANEAGVVFPYYFYDYDNRFIVRYIPTILIIYIYEKRFKGCKNGGVRTLAAMTMCFLSLLYLQSTSSCIVFLAIIIGYCFIRFRWLDTLTIRRVWMIYILASVLLSVLAVGLSSSEFIMNLGKTNSLYLRSKMWETATKEVLHAPVLGTGVLETTLMRDTYGYAQLHNSFLTTLLWGGTFGIILYSRFITSGKLAFLKERDTLEYRLCVLLFSAMMIASLFDGLELVAHTYILYFILGNYDSIGKLGEDSLSGIIM